MRYHTSSCLHTNEAGVLRLTAFLLENASSLHDLNAFFVKRTLNGQDVVFFDISGGTDHLALVDSSVFSSYVVDPAYRSII